jgi:hypothetical protein
VSAELEAPNRTARSGGPSSHTDGNWVFFRLPFDTTDVDRIRDVRLLPAATTEADVAAARLLGRCVPYAHFGPMTTWALYTKGAIGPSLAFAAHPSPPSDDPTLLALNVPTRVANYVSCERPGSAKLRDAKSWYVDASWEER